jgi:hypothetical protein
MSERGVSLRAMRGVIRSRLLVNALVDPAEAATRLPSGLRPHVVAGGTVVGCCLLDIAAIRPARLPATFGASLRAAAHRISVEWDDESGGTTVGVYVPLRLTDSRPAIALGGRIFPGVHAPARVQFIREDERVAWSVVPDDEPGAYPVRVDASCNRESTSSPCEPVGGTCLGAEVGLSPGRDGMLEGARMVPRSRDARTVEIRDLDSAFLASFSSAASAPSYLVRDVEVTWTRARVPRLEGMAALV